MMQRSSDDAPPLSTSRPLRPQSGIQRRATPVPASGPSADEYLARGDVHMDLGDPHAAIKEYVRAVSLLQAGPRRAQIDAYLRLGHANRRGGRMVACVHAYRKALDLDPRHIDALRALVDLHVEWEEWEFVQPIEERLFDVLEGDPRLHDELLRSGDRWWKRAAEPEQALLRYRRALRSFPESTRVQVRLRAVSKGLVRGDLGNLRRAALSAHAARDRAIAYLELGNAYYFDALRYRDALEAFDTAYRADETYLPALEMYVAALVELKQWARVRQIWRELSSDDGADREAARDTMREALRAVPPSQRHQRPVPSRPRSDSWPWSERPPLSSRRRAC